MTTEQPLVPPEIGRSVETPTRLTARTGKYLPPSKVKFDHLGYATYQAQPLDSKREYLRQQWLDVSYLALGKAKQLAMSLAKKDYGRLVQLLTSAGIAYDKVFPKVDTAQGNTLVFNLFKGLSTEKLLKVVGQVELPRVELPTGEVPTGELPRGEVLTVELPRG